MSNKQIHKRRSFTIRRKVNVNKEKLEYQTGMVMTREELLKAVMAFNKKCPIRR